MVLGNYGVFKSNVATSLQGCDSGIEILTGNWRKLFIMITQKNNWRK